MADNLHPVIELLLARVETHPEEFMPSSVDYDMYGNAKPIQQGESTHRERWVYTLNELERHAPAEQWELLRTAIGRKRMDILHEQALDELMNGPERRAQHQRMMRQYELEKIAQMQAQNQMVQVQAQNAALNQQAVLGRMSQSLNDAFQNAYGSASSGGGSAVR